MRFLFTNALSQNTFTPLLGAFARKNALLQGIFIFTLKQITFVLKKCK